MALAGDEPSVVGWWGEEVTAAVGGRTKSWAAQPNRRVTESVVQLVPADEDAVLYHDFDSPAFIRRIHSLLRCCCHLSPRCSRDYAAMTSSGMTLLRSASSFF